VHRDVDVDQESAPPMTDRKQTSWNVKVPTDGGPVRYLNIFDKQPDVRFPEEMRMDDDGTYHYSHTGRIYRWHPKRGR
jgi:hypothetical protein